MTGKDRDRQIVLLPYWFKQALGTDGKTLSDDLLVQLGLANLFGWLAYTLYDDVLDGEGDPTRLGVANVALREVTGIFDRILPNTTGFPAYARYVLDTIDAANTWEAVHCRLPDTGRIALHTLTIPNFADVGRLADRSLGHALGPAAILFALGYTATSSEVTHLMDVFRHYIAGRQLNDDMHDWEDDLRRGQLNAVSAMVLERLRTEDPQAVLDLNADMQRLQELFWYEVVVDACKRVRRHVSAARQALGKLRVVTDPNVLEALLRPVEQVAEVTLKERAETLKFLRVYTEPVAVSEADVGKSL